MRLAYLRPTFINLRNTYPLCRHFPSPYQHNCKRNLTQISTFNHLGTQFITYEFRMESDCFSQKYRYQIFKVGVWVDKHCSNMFTSIVLQHSQCAPCYSFVHCCCLHRPIYAITKRNVLLEKTNLSAPCFLQFQSYNWAYRPIYMPDSLDTNIEMQPSVPAPSGVKCKKEKSEVFCSAFNAVFSSNHYNLCNKTCVTEIRINERTCPYKYSTGQFFPP